MAHEYRASITVTKSGTNGDIYKKIFNGTCAVGVNKRKNGAIAEKAAAYLLAVEKSLGNVPAVEQRPNIPKLEVVSRVAAIPIVESGIEVTEKMYHKIRESNAFLRWYLSLGERSLATGMQLALPAVQILESPLHQLDRFLCASLDIVEKRVPSIHMPPQAMYSETRQYVLRRADSVKQLGSAVLDSRVTAVTANALDRALTRADMYVDKILPPDYQDAADVVIIVTQADAVDGDESGRARAVHAVQHGARLRRKLQRRLTRQALAEAKAIKEQIHVLVYVAELVATDPALAWKKARELYDSLSRPEPENQARPATLEELLVLLSRETARKVVHLINFTHTDLPRNVRQGMSMVSKGLAAAADAVLKVVLVASSERTVQSLLQTLSLHPIVPQKLSVWVPQTVPVETAISEVRGLRARLQALLQQLQDTSKTYLEHLAIFLAGNEEREKIPPRSTYETRDDLAAINGLN